MSFKFDMDVNLASGIYKQVKGYKVSKPHHTGLEIIAIAIAFDFMLFGAQQIALRIGTW